MTAEMTADEVRVIQQRAEAGEVTDIDVVALCESHELLRLQLEVLAEAR